MISSFNATSPHPDDPNTMCPVEESTSSELLVRYPAPFTACGRERDDDEDSEQDDRGEHTRDAGDAARVLALLVDARGGVPTPVDEDGDQQPVREVADASEAGRRQPRQRRVDRTRDVARVDLHECHDAEQHEDRELDQQQSHLRPRAELDTDHADPGHRQDERDPETEIRPVVVRESVEAEEQERVLATAICARLGMMMRSAIIELHPPSHPVRGPIDRVTHAKFVPQSGSARFR